MSRNDYQARPADEKIVMKRSLITGELLNSQCSVASQRHHSNGFSALRAKNPQPLNRRPSDCGDGAVPVLSLKRGYDKVETTKEGAVRVFLKLLERNRVYRQSMEKSLVCHLANFKSRDKKCGA